MRDLRARGRGDVLGREAERVVGPGDVVIVAPDEPHAFVNSGSDRPRQIDVHLSPRFETVWLDT